MKTVLLMRHAKSAWGDPALDDFDRPLAARGRGAGPAMAAHMVALGLSPDHVICSAAVRCVETWTLMAPLFEGDIPVAADEALFHASPGGLLAALRAAPGDAARLLLIAHSPGIESLAAAPSGPQSDREAYARPTATLPTAALARAAPPAGEPASLPSTEDRLCTCRTQEPESDRAGIQIQRIIQQRSQGCLLILGKRLAAESITAEVGVTLPVQYGAQEQGQDAI